MGAAAEVSARGSADELKAAFRQEVKEKTRSTAISAGLLGVVAFPVWIGFDFLVEPGNASDFALLRLTFDVPMALLLAALISPLGRRHPEALMFALVCLIEIAIAIMISRVDEEFAAYALGMSLAIYASAFLLVWPWTYAAALIGVSLGALAIAIPLAPEPLPTSAIATLAFYLGTASVLALVTQVHRNRLAWSEFSGRAKLEREQERNRDLLERLERLSREDPLTGLGNRRSWDESLEREFARARRTGLPVSVLICDIDRFKSVNDRYGHAIGDRLLETVAGVFLRRVRTGDLVARIGGDEFAILCADTDLEGSAALAESLRRRIEMISFPERPDEVTTVSIGVAERGAGDHSPSETMVVADARLYQAKRRRNAVCAADRAEGADGSALTRLPERYPEAATGT
ncbi:MAG: diguanylate cyclase [Solirubrobacterales bacterium]